MYDSYRAFCWFQGRPYTYEQLDLSGVNVMLNSNDVSEYLKISADGMQVWCFHYIMRNDKTVLYQLPFSIIGGNSIP